MDTEAQSRQLPQYFCLSILLITRFSHGSGYEAECEWTSLRH